MTTSILNSIMDYECRQMPAHKVVPFFAALVKEGLAWTLQGHYGRNAQSLIDAGLINREGEVIHNPVLDR